MMMWDNEEWADVNIRVADGLATVNFRGYDVIDSVPIDLAPIEAAQFLFAARTGGANQKHYIDDIEISLLASSTSRVSVAYDAGEPVTLLDLNSQTPTAYDESVSLALNNPEGAKSAVVTWDYQGHDNWWAIDNITVASDIEPTPALPAIATDKERYSGGKPITVSFSDGPRQSKGLDRHLPPGHDTRRAGQLGLGVCQRQHHGRRRSRQWLRGLLQQSVGG